MNRRKFALSWGRKIFFGVSMPVSFLIGLLYLRSFILPESLIDWIFFLTSYIGTFGLLNVLLFFVFYTPIILLMPTYYVSRLWSLLLILLLNILLLVDALSFSSFHFHLYDFFSKIIWNTGYEYMMASKVIVSVLITTFLAITLIFWIRGEMVWRRMQGRFSNPVSNWYIFIILFCFIAGKAIYYYSPVDENLAKVFPLHLNFRPESTVASVTDNRKFFYPTGELTCKGKNNPNIILIVIKEWGAHQLSPEMMPKIFHMKDHAINYSSHMNLSQDSETGLFSLRYSIPSSYMNLRKKAEPAIEQILKKRDYEVMEISDGPIVSKLYQWLDNRSGIETKPFFISLTFSQHPFEVDSQVDELILRLEREELLRNSEIILTGAYSGQENIPLPLMWFRPPRKSSEVKHVTTPYDVMPTLMAEFWDCKKVFETASFGTSLHEENREWIPVSTRTGFKIYDFKNNNVINYQDRRVSVFGNDPRYELIFSAMNAMTKFNRP